jgi:serine/threonine-protein kinase RsbW
VTSGVCADTVTRRGGPVARSPDVERRPPTAKRRPAVVQMPDPQQRVPEVPAAGVATQVDGLPDVTSLAEVPSPVEVRVHADPALIPSVRAVAADLAARADFDLDAVSDLRMAVDEACSALVPLASAGGQLRCGFTVIDGRVAVVARVPVDRPTSLRQDTFGWRVLDTLTDVAEVLDRDPAWIGIRLLKDRNTT